MCDAFGQQAGMSADMLFSSEVPESSTQDEVGELELEAVSDDASKAPSSQLPARSQSLGKRKHQSSVAETMIILRDGLSDIADTFKHSSGNQRGKWTR